MSVNYTTSLSADPDLEVTATSCAYGHLLVDLHAADSVGQEKYTALHDAQTDHADSIVQRDLFERVYKGLSGIRSHYTPLNTLAYS